MTSLDRLPSGEWRATVLLDTGRTATRILPTVEEAADWGMEVEADRNVERASRRDADARRTADLALAALERLARRGLLSEQQRVDLRRIAASLPPADGEP